MLAITTASLYSTNSEFRFWADSNSSYVSEFCGFVNCKQSSKCEVGLQVYATKTIRQHYVYHFMFQSCKVQTSDLQCKSIK